MRQQRVMRALAAPNGSIMRNERLMNTAIPNTPAWVNPTGQARPSKSNADIETAIMRPFDAAGHLTRWSTPFTLYPTAARSNYTTFSPTLNNFSSGGSAASYIFLRGDGYATATYNYPCIDGIADWNSVVGATTVDLGAKSALFIERPTGIGLKVKYASVSNAYQAKVIAIPIPPGQNAPGGLTGYLPSDARLPITETLKRLGTREGFVTNGQSAEVTCSPVDSRGLDLLAGSAARASSGWNNWAICIQTPNITNLDAKLTVELVFHYEGVELLGSTAPEAYANPIARPDQQKFDKTMGKVINLIEKGFNFCINSGPVREAVAGLGHLASTWMGLALLEPRQCTTLLNHIGTMSKSSARCVDESKEPLDIEDCRLPKDALSDPPEMVTPKIARRPSLTLSLTSRKK